MGNFLTNEQTEFVDTSIGFTNFNFIDDVGVYALVSLVPKDTTFLVNQYYELDTSLEQSYEIDGVLIDDGLQYFDVVGNYIVDIMLEGCDYIGFFEIEVIDCASYISLRDIAYLSPDQYCYRAGLRVDLLPYSEFGYRLNGEEVAATYVDLSRIGIDTITLYHEQCGDVHETIYVVLDCSSDLQGDCFFVPNIFSPNRDGYNDAFRVFGTCEVTAYSMNVYNRWGNHIFASDNIDIGWNGKYKGEISDEGVYIYTVSISYVDELAIATQVENGSITLIR